jgi:hypothetical protein
MTERIRTDSRATVKHARDTCKTSRDIIERSKQAVERAKKTSTLRRLYWSYFLSLKVNLHDPTCENARLLLPLKLFAQLSTEVFLPLSTTNYRQLKIFLERIEIAIAMQQRKPLAKTKRRD